MVYILVSVLCKFFNIIQKPSFFNEEGHSVSWNFSAQNGEDARAEVVRKL